MVVNRTNKLLIRINSKSIRSRASNCKLIRKNNPKIPINQLRSFVLPNFIIFYSSNFRYFLADL